MKKFVLVLILCQSLTTVLAIETDTIGSSRFDWQWCEEPGRSAGYPHRYVVYEPITNCLHTIWPREDSSTYEIVLFYNSCKGNIWSKGTGLNGGMPCQTGYSTGSPTIDYTSQSHAVIIFRNLQNGNIIVGIDSSIGEGNFIFQDIPGSSAYCFPCGATDAMQDIAIIASRNDSLYSICSSDLGQTWSIWKYINETGANILFGSKYSQKMCATYRKEEIEKGLYNAHVVYLESQDGGVNWGIPFDITALMPLPGGHGYSIEELRHCACNIYGIYDSNDDLHIVWDAGLGTKNGGTYYPSLPCVIWFYSNAGDSSIIKMVSYHPLPANLAWAPAGGDWNNVLYPYYGGIQAKPIIAEDPITKYLYVVWIEFPYDIISPNGREAGEVYTTYSLSKGVTWAPKINLTMTPQLCEVYANIPPIVKDTLPILYYTDSTSYSNVHLDTQLDPSRNSISCLKIPVKMGDLSVVSIDSIPSCPDTLYPGKVYTPIATYRNNTGVPLSFQSRFEITVHDTIPIDVDTLFSPTIFYYDIVNIDNLAPYQDTQVVFKQWVCDTGIKDKRVYYTVSGSFLVDTLLGDNILTDSAHVVSIEEAENNFKQKIEIYPNPMKGHNILSYNLSYKAYVKVKIYDISGRLIRVLVNKEEKPGNHNVNWNGHDIFNRKVISGIYFYKIEIGNFCIIKKIVVLR